MEILHKFHVEYIFIFLVCLLLREIKHGRLPFEEIQRGFSGIYVHKIQNTIFLGSCVVYVYTNVVNMCTQYVVIYVVD